MSGPNYCGDAAGPPPSGDHTASAVKTTPSLPEFRSRYGADDDEWRRLDCGHHQSLFDAACEQLDAPRAALTAAPPLDEGLAAPSRSLADHSRALDALIARTRQYRTGSISRSGLYSWTVRRQVGSVIDWPTVHRTPRAARKALQSFIENAHIKGRAP